LKLGNAVWPVVVLFSFPLHSGRERKVLLRNSWLRKDRKALNTTMSWKRACVPHLSKSVEDPQISYLKVITCSATGVAVKKVKYRVNCDHLLIPRRRVVSMEILMRT
jgi:hypothetical protein